MDLTRKVVIAFIEAVEKLIREGYHPRRIMISFGDVKATYGSGAGLLLKYLLPKAFALRW